LKPLVALVGRPNVGKSTLFNRLVGRNLAIVHDTPGVTRDRHYADADLLGRAVTVIDTGGFDAAPDDALGSRVAAQAEAAIEEADVIVCVLDGRAPPLASDAAVVELLRRSGKRTLFVANKIDAREHGAIASELYALGMDALIPVSALHGLGTAQLLSALAESVPAPAEEPPPPESDVPRVALVGRPNAGKSTLFNQLAGAERSLVDGRPGTTRDPIDALVNRGGRRLLLVDTAGIRRRTRVEQGVEALSVMQALRAIPRAEVAVLVVDAAAGVTEQDARLLGLCSEKRRAVVVALNKMDCVPRDEQKSALERAQTALHFAPWAPRLPLSAKSGKGVDALVAAVLRAAKQFRKRVSTAELNRFFARVLESHPPPTHRGRAPRIYYVTQAEVAPPVFVAMTNAPDHIRDSYKRFVQNRIREAFAFDAIPVRVEYRQRTRR
jgi:GTP-binding protein